MTTKKKAEDKRPVTHGELDPLMTAIKEDLNQITKRLDQTATKDDLAEVKREVAGLKQLQQKTLRLQEATYTAVQDLAKARTETADHGERIERLEKAVLKPPATH